MEASTAMSYFDSSGPWIFNPNAVSLMFVQMEFYYINESWEDGPLVKTGRVDAYTEVNHFLISRSNTTATSSSSTQKRR